ncbi:hypothetical protein T492DRAFT_883373 [Pavlovales sp. CCMP2436]|nr:hypothetical protein T492DRAFT_883373 [Pavlovales sp. CCMP2436]
MQVEEKTAGRIAPVRKAKALAPEVKRHVDAELVQFQILSDDYKKPKSQL